MNRRSFDAILYAVAHDREMKRHEFESVLAEASRVRDAIDTFCSACVEGASAHEIANLRLVLEGAPFGQTSIAVRRAVNHGRPKGVRPK